MRAYYNEIDPYAAQWLRNLITAGHIAPGDVDERSIADVQPSELVRYTQCHFFAGIGIWSYALRCAGWPDDRPVWTGSCPCQPFSSAGSAGGFDDGRHLWPHWSRLIGECKPSVVFGEQVASRDGLAWLDFVCADMEAAGYAIGAIDTCAAGYGAPHIRQRLYFVADSQCVERRSIDHARRNEGQHGIFQREESADRIGSCIEAVIVAESTCGRTRPEKQFRQRRVVGLDCQAGDFGNAAGGRFGIDGSAPRTPGYPDEPKQVSRMEHANGPGQDERPPSGQQSLCDEYGACGVALGDTEQPGLEGHGWHGVDGNQPGRIRTHEAGSIGAAGAVGGFWRDADWIYCRGFGTIPPSYRPVEPGSFPLVAGIAARMDKLRAFGNCIVAPQATEFVRAYCGVTD